MPIQSAEDLFIRTLSNLHSAETRTKAICDELAQMAQEPEVKGWFTVTSYLEGQHVANVEQCFKILGKQPEKSESKWLDVFAENFKNIWNEIQSPQMKAIYLLATIRKVQNFHIAEYGTLAVMAGFAGYDGVALLLERNREDKISYIERANEMLAGRVRQELGSRVRQELGERVLKRVA